MSNELNKYIAIADAEERKADSREFARFAGNGWFSAPFEDLANIYKVTAKAISRKERSAHCRIFNGKEIKQFIDPMFKGIITISYDDYICANATITINIDYSALSDTEFKTMVDKMKDYTPFRLFTLRTL